MGIHMYQYSPCLLWYLVDEKQHRINITCDLIFVYLVEEYNLFKRLGYKLQRTEAGFLSKQKMSLEQEVAPHPVRVLQERMSVLKWLPLEIWLQL